MDNNFDVSDKVVPNGSKYKGLYFVDSYWIFYIVGYSDVILLLFITMTVENKERKQNEQKHTTNLSTENEFKWIYYHIIANTASS